MQDKLEKLKEFNSAFKIKYKESPSLNVGELRYELMKEENEEYLEAVKNNDPIGIADALGDELYILCGTILHHGMQHVIDKVFNIIHESNMSKLDDNGNPVVNGENGALDISKPLGKIIKSKNFKEPDLSFIIEE